MKKILIYICIFLTLSFLGHSYIIYRFIHDGVLFTGQRWYRTDDTYSNVSI